MTLPADIAIDLHQDGLRIRTCVEHQEVEITSTYADRCHVPYRHLGQLIRWLRAVEFAIGAGQ